MEDFDSTPVPRFAYIRTRPSWISTLRAIRPLFARANVQYDTWGGVPAYPDTPAPDEWDHPWGFAVGHTWTIHNNLVNKLTYGYTRQSFTKGGDLFHNDIDFRFVYYPTNELFSLSRVTPVNNWVDDLSWVKGSHTIQFGVNVTKSNNVRTSYSNAYDQAITNPSYYLTNLLRGPLSNYVLAQDGIPMFGGDGSSAENAMTRDYRPLYSIHRRLHLRAQSAVDSFRGSDNSKFRRSELRRLRAGHVESETEPDRHHGPPVRDSATYL